MEFEWNEQKAQANFAKHEVSFEEAKTVFDDALFLMFPDIDHSFEGNRFIFMGEFDKGRLLVVSFTGRKTSTRLISARKQHRRNVDFMKKKDNELNDELRPEYDFSKMPVIRRGSGRKQQESITVTLAPDVAKKFPTSEAVNEALRLIIRIADETNKLQPS
jgi:uncharacterized DUF497 family protein